MKRIITAAQAKEIDRYSIEELKMPEIVLMERAAIRFAEHVIEYIKREKELEKGSEKKFLIVCGSGNNGGDGMAIARILSQAGYCCAVFLAGKQEKMTESANIQWKLLETLSIPVIREFNPEPETIIVDALFGIGLSREVTGDYAKLIQEMNHFRCFSVDIPSGMNADTGLGMVVCREGSQRTAIKAEFTVTFGPVKTGLLLGVGRQYAGKVFARDIGFPTQAIERCLSGWHLEVSDIQVLLPKRKEDSNKGSYGRVLIFAGSETMLGAAYYVGKAAYRIGAGLVEIVTCRQNIAAIASMLPAAVYTPFEELFFEDDQEEKADKEALEQKIYAASSVVLGPGLGISRRAECIVGAVLAICNRIGKPCILDADGLNILSMHMEWQRLLTETMILTPHIKEMSRLCKKRTSEIKENIIGLAREFSQKHHKTVLLLKDSRSVITDGTEYFINVSGNHGMAVGGSGDVLSGILGGLMAQAEKAKEDKIGELENSREVLKEKQEISNTVLMAALGAYLHGLAGDYAITKICNPYSMMAEDILDGMKDIIVQ